MNNSDTPTVPNSSPETPETGAAPKKRGRPPGARNKATLERQLRTEADIAKARAEGITPLEYMLKVMREEPPAREEGEDALTYFMRTKEHTKRRDIMAAEAAPYVHPKLAQVDHTGDGDTSHEDALNELE